MLENKNMISNMVSSSKVTI